MIIDTPKKDGEDAIKLGGLQIVNNNTTEVLWENFTRWHEIYLNLPSDVDKNTLLKSIEMAVDEIHKKDIYASWSEWDIYRISLKDKKWGFREFKVAKKRLDNNPDNEYSLQMRIQSLVHDWDPVQIPKLIWVLEDDEKNNYIIMEFIKWKTLYHKIAEWIIESKAKQIEASAIWKTETEKNIAYQEAFNLRNEIKSAQSDSDVDHIFLKWYQYDSKKTTEAFDREKFKVQIFWSEEWKKIKNELWAFIEKLHKNWFYHRDLHEKNIIFWDDGKIYVIDFWKSFFKDPKEWVPSDTEVYIVDMWEQEWRYPTDESILGIIGKVTKSKEDEKEEEFVKRLKEESKRLTAGQMVIEWIDFDKIKSKRLLNRIKKYFWWIEQLKKKIAKEEKYESTINSFIGVTDEDFILTLFSITKENLDKILVDGIPTAKKNIIGKIKERRFYSLWKQSRIDLFWGIDEDIDISFLSDVLKQIDKWTGYEEVYKNKGLRGYDLGLMLENTKKLEKIEWVKWFLEIINNAIV